MSHKINYHYTYLSSCHPIQLQTIRIPMSQENK